MPDPATRQAAAPSSSWASLLVGPAFLALAAWFVWGPNLLEVPESKPTKVLASALSTAPQRTPLADPPKIDLAGFERTCMDCHRAFDSNKFAETGKLQQHTEIALDHGSHRGCYGCHDRKDRDRLLLLNGDKVGYSASDSLCAQCHGSTHRDWLHGTHGRTNGYWDPTRGERKRLRCTECHDPHRPRYPAMRKLTPLPGPNGLRAEPKQPDAHGDHAVPHGFDPQDPLYRALQATHPKKSDDH